jgi:glycosyltransferase involved in cell wall biosynthesis
LNILVLSDYFPPHKGGGVERAAYEVSRRVAARGHEVTVVTLNSRKAPARERLDGMDVIRVPGIDLTKALGIQVAFSLGAYKAINEVLRSRQIDVIHAHSIFFQLSLLGTLLGKRHKVPVVTTAHLGSVRDLGGRYALPSMAYERTLGRAVLAGSARVVAVSEAVRRHVSGLGAGAKTVTIPNGVDAALFSPGLRDSSRVRALFVGRLVFNKGPQFLLAALPEVLQRFPGTEIVIVGDGPMRADLEATVKRMGLERNVAFLGERDDVAAILKQGDILVRPSLLEGLPLAVLEGMASGLAVIATRVGGTPELIEHGRTGLLIDPGQPQQLADALLQLLANPTGRAEMGRMAREHIESSYDWDRNAEQTLVIYAQSSRLEGAVA